MDSLENMRVFVAVAEGAGFAAAARRLRMSPPAVTRAIAALEEHVGARLLNRTTRTVRLTESGQRFLVDVKRILADLAEAEASAAGTHGELRGTLSVTAPTMFGRMHVAPVLLEFLEKHRAVVGRFLVLDRIVSLAEEGVDVAVRIAHLSDSSLVAVKVGSVRPMVVASPGYVRKHKKIRSPEDLSQHDCIVVDASFGRSVWTFGEGAEELSVHPRVRMIVNTSEVAIGAALAGHGVTRVLSYQAAAHVRSGALVDVLPAFQCEIPVHLVYAEGRHAALRSRAFVDFAAPRLRKVISTGQ
jgi:DNA-binding transcriptional LysR family regulator